MTTMGPTGAGNGPAGPTARARRPGAACDAGRGAAAGARGRRSGGVGPGRGRDRLAAARGVGGPARAAGRRAGGADRRPAGRHADRRWSRPRPTRASCSCSDCWRCSIVIGLVMVLSASSDQAIIQHASPWAYFETPGPLGRLGTGGVCRAVRVIDYRTWRRFSLPLLATVDGPAGRPCASRTSGSASAGRAAGSASASLQFQPSELAKLALVLFAADLLARRADRMRDTRFTFRPGGARARGHGRAGHEATGHGHDDRPRRSSPSPCCSSRGHRRAPWRPRPRRPPAPGACMLGVVAPYRLRRLLCVPPPRTRRRQHRLPGGPGPGRHSATGRLVRRRARRRPARRRATCPTPTPTSSSPSSARRSASSVASS